MTFEHQNQRRFIMAGKADEFKGRTKEAAGAATDNDDLRSEGKVNQASGKAKEAIEKGKDALQEGVNKVKQAWQNE
jgi:uncharacterized protein YjbJ (UPF0337 family)